jgi:hypothetical protein
MKNSTGKYLMIITIGIVVVFLLYGSTESFVDILGRKTPAEVEDVQMAILDERYDRQERTSLAYSALKKLPANQQILINTHLFASRYGAYVGPLRGGVFPKDVQTIGALTYRTGFRLIVIELGMEPDHVSPKLVAIDNEGVRGEVGGVEKGSGYLKRYIDSLIEIHGARAGDPLILYIHFHDYPNPAKEPRNFLQFTGTVAKALSSAEPHLLRDSPTGTYGRQGQESKLFFTQIKDLGSKPVILLTNIDTTIYRKLKEIQLPSVKTEEDFDLKVHARVYGPADKLKTKPAVFAAPADYWLETPETMIADAQSKTKEQFSIVFPVNVGGISAGQAETLYSVYGVNAIAFPMFDDEAEHMWGRKSAHYKESWIAKAPMLRYVPPEPIIVNPASTKTNSGGGRIVAPSLG